MARDRYGGDNGMVGYDSNAYSQERYDRGAEAMDAGGDIMNGGMSGAQKGMSVGGPIGALIGGAFGAIGGGIRGGRNRREAREREAEKRAAWDRAQQQLARERYAARAAASQSVQLGYSPANLSLQGMYGRNSALDLSQNPWGGGEQPKGGDAYSPAAAAKKPAGRTKETARKAGNPEPAPKDRRTGMKPKVR